MSTPTSRAERTPSSNPSPRRETPDRYRSQPSSLDRLVQIGVAALVIVLLILGCSDGESDTPPPRLGGIDAGKPEISARAILRPTRGYTARGVIDLLWEGSGTRLDANFEDLAPGHHAFHVHEFGDCSAPDASSAGQHFALVDTEGSPDRIMGNLGEIKADADGRASFEVVVDDAQLAGRRSIVGKSIVVHAQGNDPNELPGGGAGARIACGVIEKVH